LPQNPKTPFDKTRINFMKEIENKDPNNFERALEEKANLSTGASSAGSIKNQEELI